MKHTRRIASLLLALVMVFAMATTAFATQEGELTGGSITINDAVSGHTYNAYQILYLESYSGVGTTPDTDGNVSGGNFAYKANSAWATWLASQTSYVSIDNEGYVTWVEGADVAAFAKAAQAQLASKSIDATATCAADSTSVTMNNLMLGYYLVDTTLGSLCSLDTTNPNVVMKEKNEVPTVTKEVQEDSDSSWSEKNDADIGQIVNFKTTITVHPGTTVLDLHDVMSDALTLDANSIVVGSLTAGTDYTLTTTWEEGKACTHDGKGTCDFVIDFKDTYLSKITTETTIVVTYSAVVNKNAVVATAMPNETAIKYDNESWSNWNKTNTYTWDMDVLKYANGVKDDVLKDAQFVLLNSNKSKVATVVDGKLTGWVDIPTAATDGTITWPANTTLTTGEDGKIAIDGLDADTYNLREIKAPDGYNKLNEDKEVIVTAGTVNNNTVTYTTVVAEVNNQSGSELPSTGGMGTTLFYVVGGLMVAAAVVLLVTKKRMASAE